MIFACLLAIASVSVQATEIVKLRAAFEVRVCNQNGCSIQMPQYKDIEIALDTQYPDESPSGEAHIVTNAEPYVFDA